MEHKYFTIGELLQSETATDNKIDNCNITIEQEQNLDALIVNILDPAREELGEPINVSSGFRCDTLNKKVKGVATSQHKKGEAADLQTKSEESLKRLFDILAKMDVDQLLYEYTAKGKKWIHVSYKRDGNNRNYINNNYKAK